MTSEASAESDPAEALNYELTALLSQIERAHPDVARASLAGRVDDLLGRSAPPVTSGSEPAARAERRNRAHETDEPTRYEWYQAVVSKVPPVLNRTAAAEAARCVEAGLLAEERLASLPRRRLAKDDTPELEYLVAKGRAAFELLVTSNIRLAFHWSKGFAWSLDEHWGQDAFQAGCLGLIRGLQGWDHQQGYALSTYVSWHVRQAIQRWRWTDVDLIRLPVHVWEQLASDSPNLSPGIESAAKQALNIVSIHVLLEDELTWDGGFEEFGSGIARQQAVTAALDLLTPREAEVLSLRFGLGDQAGVPQMMGT